MEKLAIIGANKAITMLINKAKEMGFETHVFAWKCGDPGERAADFFYPISIDRKEEIATKCKEIGVIGVCSITSDFAAPTVNYVARQLGLPCNPEITSEVARNKYKMRCAFKECGLYTPPFIQIGEDYSDNEIDSLQYPVIVKPTDRWSSKGVTRVNCKEKMDNALRYAINESFDKHAIVEGFMEGPEYSAECICFNGNKKILAFTKKETTGYPNYIETGHFQPADLSSEERERATVIIYRALEALHIENSAAHAEFRILSNGEIGIIEIGARMGGDCIGTDLTPNSTGMDYIRMVIDVACGKTPVFSEVAKSRQVAIKYILSQYDYDRFLYMRKTNASSIIRYEIDNLDFEKKVVDSSTRHGFFIYWV